MITHYDLIYDSEKNLHLDLFLPETESFDLLIYFHGGGLNSYSHKGFDPYADYFAKANIATASVEYRLYPNAKFPDFIEDTAKSVKWLMDNISAYGKCNNIFVSGSSAGAYLTMMLCFDKKYLNAVGLNPTDIDGYIHDSGQPTTHFNVLKEYGYDYRRVIVDEKSPMYFVGMEEKYSPMLFLVATNDMHCRLEQTKMMVKLLEDFGHKDTVFLEVLEGKHCENTWKINEKGESVFVNLVLNFKNAIFKNLGEKK